MKSPEPVNEIVAGTPLPGSELRDWSDLPDLVTGKVLSRLVPCLHSLSAFASTCRPWRRVFVATASTILPRIPPLILQAQYHSSRLLGFSPLVIGEPRTVPLPGFRASLLCASRGYLVLLVGLGDARRGTLVVTDALTGVERLVVPLPRDELQWHGYYHYRYATVTPTHLLVFDDCRHEFASLPFPAKHPDQDQEWTHHRLPRGSGSVSSVVDFHGRVLGVTDRAELLEFRVPIIHHRDQYRARSVKLLPTTGLGAAFESSVFGPRLVVAGHRLLLLLLMTDEVRRVGLGDVSMLSAEVKKVSVRALDMAAMRWEELDDIGEYSLFVDCPGRTAVACAADTAGCGVVANRVYFLVSRSYYCFDYGQPPFQAFPPGSDGEPTGGDSPWHKLISDDDYSEWPPSQTWVYPSLFYRC